MAAPFKMNESAQTGFSNASHYDAHRPSYPEEAVSKLLKHLGVADQPKAQIVELASGTGKFTELLVKRGENYEIVAVEPHEGMRGELVKKLKMIGESYEKRVLVTDGHSGSMNIEDGWGDALIAAQAFHWFATEESLKEIHRVLRPGATFGMIWNIDDYNGARDWTPKSKLDQRLKDIVRSTEDGQPRFRHMKWKDVFENQTETTPLQTLVDTFTKNFPSFSLPLGEETVAWTTWLSDEAVWARFSTLSHIANLSKEKRNRVQQQVVEALGGDYVERNEKGEAALHGLTYFAWTSRV